MGVLLGFDPGGAGAFGWCIVEDADQPPLRVLSCGVARHAKDALHSVITHLPAEMDVQAAGIDAPLFWTASGNRVADKTVRSDIKKCGAPFAEGTVQAVNSLRGACLAQGMMLGVLLRNQWRELSITESHPKAYLWLAGSANENRQPRDIDLASLPLFRCENSDECDEHVRDAAITTLSAWAMVHHEPGWRDLLLGEQEAPFSPVGEPLGYWMPDSPQAAQHAAGADR